MNENSDRQEDASDARTGPFRQVSESTIVLIFCIWSLLVVGAFFFHAQDHLLKKLTEFGWW